MTTKKRWLGALFADKAPKETRRRGILRGTSVGAGWFNEGITYAWTIEVEELDRIGKFSKLRFGEVSGANREMLLDDFPEWVPTKDVIWEENV